MKYYLHLGFVLLLITALASGILAYINGLTAPIIEENQRLTKENARKEVMPDAASFENIGTYNEEGIFIAKNDAGEVVGFTFLASLYGYSSDVKSMVGVNKDMIVNKIKVISQTETPGLGANCEKPEFQAQFSNKDIQQMKVDKDGGSIVSLTGATITTRTIANSIRNGMEYLLTLDVVKNIEEPAEIAESVEETMEVTE
jgi:H+/Na+-translocating ferredoxin:NAD+ oxidoreductase subunit G